MLQAAPFLDISSEYWPTNGSAMGSVAFHPDFASNRRLYVVMTELENPASADFGVMSGVAQQSVLYEVEAQASFGQAGANVANPASQRELFRINEGNTIHNLNDLAFGPDGYLYASKGDDLTGGQDPRTIHGTILRIDVDRRPGNPLSTNGQYAIPADNPRPGASGRLREIWAHGFRNPWRLGFDQATGSLWVADVGQDDVEEIDLVLRGRNYGWRVWEGSFLVLGRGGVAKPYIDITGVYTEPIGQYDHDQGHRSVTGGFVYRGTRYPALVGQYVFGDWISGALFHMNTTSGRIRRLAVDPLGAQIDGQGNGGVEEGIISMGQGADGELYVVVTQRNMSATGRVLRL